MSLRVRAAMTRCAVASVVGGRRQTVPVEQRRKVAAQTVRMTQRPRRRCQRTAATPEKDWQLMISHRTRVSMRLMNGQRITLQCATSVEVLELTEEALIGEENAPKTWLLLRRSRVPEAKAANEFPVPREGRCKAAWSAKDTECSGQLGAQENKAYRMALIQYRLVVESMEETRNRKVASCESILASLACRLLVVRDGWKHKDTSHVGGDDTAGVKS
jgi:hypothetical protein